MSSNFCCLPKTIRVAVASAVILGLCAARAGAARTLESAAPPPLPAERFWEVVRLEADQLPRSVLGAARSQLALYACRPKCQPVPWQLDERDANDQFVLDHGPEPAQDDPPDLLDRNDLIVFMAADAGERVGRDDLPLTGGDADIPSDRPLTGKSTREPHSPAVAVAEIEVTDARTGRHAWAYLLRFPERAPRVQTAYVEYDPSTDRITAARAVLGFTKATPRYLALLDDDGHAQENLLVRMKVRATARFLWGLFAVTRSEDDIQSQLVAWKAGPIRVIRRQRLWVRLAWGFRTPIMTSDAFVSRDVAELPLHFHLNFSPRLLFADVAVRASLGFRALNGWEVEVPNAPGRVRVDGATTPDKQALNALPADWFALRGPDATVVETIGQSASLKRLKRRLYYKEDNRIDLPELERGQMPDIGYRFTHWERVSSGDHWFTSNSYVLPAGQSVADFLEALRHPLDTAVRER